MGDITGKGEHVFQPSMPHGEFRFGGFLPLLGGTRPPSVAAMNFAVVRSLTVVGADATAGTFTIDGDHVVDLDVGRTFEITGSTGGTNDGSYMSTGALLVAGQTVVSVAVVPADDTIGLCWPSVYNMSAAEVQVREPCYLSGPQQFTNNNGVSTVYLTLWDGEPHVAGSQEIQTMEITSLATVTVDLAGTVLVVRNGLWFEVDGDYPNITARLLINY